MSHTDFFHCPRHKGTHHQFECARPITSAQVMSATGRIPGGGRLGFRRMRLRFGVERVTGMLASAIGTTRPRLPRHHPQAAASSAIWRGFDIQICLPGELAGIASPGECG
jgi:hypothetical protein